MTDVTIHTISMPERQSLLQHQRRAMSGDVVLRGVTLCSALTILVMIVSLLIVLGIASMPTIRYAGLKFFTHTNWETDPDRVTPDTLGALPVIYGTVISSIIALALAIPLSFGAAIFLVRIAPRWLAHPVSFLVEFLAAIPSIAYGLWGRLILGAFLADHVEPTVKTVFGHIGFLSWMFYDHNGREWPLSGWDMLCGGLILGIMILPIITAISRDVLRAVPRAQVEGTVALGATWWESSKEMLKFSRSGLFGAVMLGLARAAGETMAIAMVIGNQARISASPFAPSQTMASLLANQFQEADGIQRSALVEVALTLLVMSLIFNIVARKLVVGSGARTAAAH